MQYPLQPTEFKPGLYNPEWYARDFLYSRDGRKEFPDHHCKLTYMVSKPYIKSWRNAVDIGSRDGEYSRYLQHDFAHVYCFDPNRNGNFPYNVDLDKITHFQCALGDETCTIQMTAGQHVLVEGKIREHPCHRLDEFGLEDVDYIKIDVEGFEQRVLKGGAETIARCRPIIIIEQGEVVAPGETRYTAKEYLEGLDFVHVATCPRGWDHVMVPREKLDD